jgi:hypothetical protein
MLYVYLHSYIHIYIPRVFGIYIYIYIHIGRRGRVQITQRIVKCGCEQGLAQLPAAGHVERGDDDCVLTLGFGT